MLKVFYTEEALSDLDRIGAWGIQEFGIEAVDRYAHLIDFTVERLRENPREVGVRPSLNRANRNYCKDRGIRLSGPALGRPPKVTEENAAKLKAEKKRHRQDELDRIPVEGKFGNAKRKGTLERIMAKLAHTSVSVSNIGLIVLNLDTWLRHIFLWLLAESSCLRRQLWNAHWQENTWMSSRNSHST